MLFRSQKQTQSFKGALFKSFPTKEEAQNYLEDKPSVNISEQDDDRYYIYVDGSYINGEYSWGMAIFYKGKLIDTFNGKGTSIDASELHNVAGEIQGAMEATKWAHEKIHAVISLVCTSPQQFLIFQIIGKHKAAVRLRITVHY